MTKSGALAACIASWSMAAWADDPLPRAKPDEVGVPLGRLD